MDQGIEKIKSTADRQQLKKQVQRVYVHTMLLAIILTGLFFLLP